MSGTFDPIHYGHIRLAVEAATRLGFEQVRLIPGHIPPHRPMPHAAPVHRQNMIRLAIDNIPKLCLDSRELECDKTSYTINTLKSLRRDYSDDMLLLIVGRDVFNRIDIWKNYEQLTDYVHIIVADRPGAARVYLPETPHDWINRHAIHNPSVLDKVKNGYIVFIKIPLLDISSRQLRRDYQAGKTIVGLLPPIVLEYIKDHHLYQDQDTT